MFFTQVDTFTMLSSKTVNAIENLAINIAAQNDGNLFIVQLSPYFALSLQQLNECVAQMVDNSSILKLESNGTSYYKFKNISTNQLPPFSQQVKEGDTDGDIRRTRILHQVLHAASRLNDQVFPASIAANTDFTLQDVKSTLEELNVDGFISEKLDEENGGIYYDFPEFTYPDKNYKIIMTMLLPKGSQESFDATMGTFMKYMFICLCMLTLMFFAKVNFRLLVLLFIASMPLSAVMTYFNNKKLRGK
ncbi:MAG: hypothetical protein NE334_14705 [Lentisphaeraceae bacterium]|nr:hypothetical protein [Lentisphaeraceae bacterium]